MGSPQQPLHLYHMEPMEEFQPTEDMEELSMPQQQLRPYHMEPMAEFQPMEEFQSPLQPHRHTEHMEEFQPMEEFQSPLQPHHHMEHMEEFQPMEHMEGLVPLEESRAPQCFELEESFCTRLCFIFLFQLSNNCLSVDMAYTVKAVLLISIILLPRRFSPPHASNLKPSVLIMTNQLRSWL